MFLLALIVKIDGYPTFDARVPHELNGIAIEYLDCSEAIVRQTDNFLVKLGERSLLVFRRHLYLIAE